MLSHSVLVLIQKEKEFSYTVGHYTQARDQINVDHFGFLKFIALIS